ncbi:tetratricopeptide repeat protein [Caballeronia sp. SEWSISQ10-4 2]|uniref:tetratricopeptide repeat protein n=1 Tax=Caballeronia sp. SEWSISQ10-4 2 TaxID=2937438 RepID=UPI002655AA92|nr:tetratricopeptide repeat protein [Caballeronia sp. SEWSISQ10-4 2]MDN7183420.1 tetratricopeptide repeat protein [Caballeronia sp. SEWSISQ10-4 2]
MDQHAHFTHRVYRPVSRRRLSEHTNYQGEGQARAAAQNLHVDNVLAAAMLRAIRQANSIAEPGSEPACTSRFQKYWLSVRRLATRGVDWMDKAQKIVIAMIVLAVAVFGFIYGYMGWRPVTIIDAIATPDDFGKKGFTAATTQRKFEENLTAILDSASSVMPTEIHEQMQEGGQQDVHLEIPGAGISLQETLAAAKALFNRDGRISAEMVVEGNTLVLSGRAMRPGGATKPFQATSPTDSIDEVIAKGAAAALSIYSPYVLASATLDKAQKACDKGACSFDAAKSDFQHMLESDSADDRKFAPWAHLGLSKIAEDEADYQNEIEHARAATQLSPHFSWANYNWAVALEHLQCFPQAEEKYREVVKYNDRYAAGHNSLGRLILASAEAAPAPAQLERSSLATRTERAHEAEVQFLAATSRDPQYSEAFVNYGVALLLQERYAQALKALRRATVIDPEHAGRAFSKIAVVADIRKQPDMAAVARKKAELADKHNASCRSNDAPSERALHGCSDLPPITGSESTMVRISAKPHFDAVDCQKLGADN